MKLSETESLEYLLKQGFKISTRQFYNLKKQIKESRFDRLHLIAASGFVDQHLERLDQLESVNQELWTLYRQEQNTFKKVLILEKIAELQSIMSTFQDAFRYVMEQSIKERKKKKTVDDNEDNQSQSISTE